MDPIQEMQAAVAAFKKAEREQVKVDIDAVFKAIEDKSDKDFNNGLFDLILQTAHEVDKDFKFPEDFKYTEDSIKTVLGNLNAKYIVLLQGMMMIMVSRGAGHQEAVDILVKEFKEKSKDTFSPTKQLLIEFSEME